MSESYWSSVGPGDRTWGTVFSLPMSGAESSEEPVQKAQVLRHSQRGIHCPGRAKCFLGAVASEWNLKGLIIVSGWIDGASQGALVVKNRAANAGDVRDVGSISVLGRFPGVGNGNLLQYSCLGNPMDRGAWWATVRGAAQRWTQLSDWTTMARAGLTPTPSPESEGFSKSWPLGKTRKAENLLQFGMTLTEKLKESKKADLCFSSWLILPALPSPWLCTK